MGDIGRIKAWREEVLEQMRKITSLERGTINEQYLKVRRQGKQEPVLRGPYYVISRREGSRTVSYRLKGEEEISRARRDVESRSRFRELCREYEELTEVLGRLERSMDDAAERKKKPRRSRSSKTRR